jgi:hypothetical protein
MGGAKRYPSPGVHVSMGFAKSSTHPTRWIGRGSAQPGPARFDSGPTPDRLEAGTKTRPPDVAGTARWTRTRRDGALIPNASAGAPAVHDARAHRSCMATGAASVCGIGRADAGDDGENGHDQNSSHCCPPCLDCHPTFDPRINRITTARNNAWPIFAELVGWVERSDTHQLACMSRWVSQKAQPILLAGRRHRIAVPAARIEY